jgi:protein-L-isoaspartate(D-aspartate) O-methyltransferase
MTVAPSAAALHAPAEDFENARRMMVDGQVTPMGVIDPLLLAAMREIPRERFVPPALRHRAHADALLPLAPGRVMLTAMVQARLLQALAPQPGDRALVLAAGSGYTAALLARMGLMVTAVEEDAALAAMARHAFDMVLTEGRPDVLVADPARGHAPGAPYRVILIEGAVPRVPPALLEQMAEGGRLGVIRAGQGVVAQALLLRRAGGGLGETVLFETQAPVLAAFADRAGFGF